MYLGGKCLKHQCRTDRGADAIVPWERPGGACTFRGSPRRFIRLICPLAMALCCATTWANHQTQPEQKQEQKDKELGERLIRKAVTDADEDIMTTIIRLMNEVSRKVEVEFDAGDNTQALQKRIMDQLDEAIKVAAAQRRPQRAMQRPSEGDKRRKQQTRKRPEGTDAGSQGDAQEDSSSKSGEPGTAAGAAGGDASGFDARRAWGHLPPRQRDEVIQGIGEEFLERYRVWVERYYRALQEAKE